MHAFDGGSRGLDAANSPKLQLERYSCTTDPALSGSKRDQSRLVFLSVCGSVLIRSLSTRFWREDGPGWVGIGVG